MVRLIRLVKLFKYAEQTNAKKTKDGQVIPEVVELEDDDEEMLPESHVGTEMTERTTKKVIMGVLGMLIAIPNLQSDATDYTKNYALRLLSDQRIEAMGYYSSNGLNLDTFESDTNYMSMKGVWEGTRDYLISDTKCFSIKFEIEEGQEWKDDVFEAGVENESFGDYETQESLKLRAAEMTSYKITNNGTIITAKFNMEADSQEASEKSLILTTVVIFILGGVTMLFTQDVNRKVLRPIETMIELVKEISENPLAKEFKSISNKDIHNKNDGMETTLILQTITKIAGLMRVGFGEAGAEIIAKNLGKSDSAGMSLLGDGVKIKSIFGFCDIRNFTDTTECLQEEVMLFVNRIANILHGIVVQCKGAANKNIGDAFLLTWKLHEERMVKGGSQEFVADQALLSLLKTTAEMARHEDFICNFSSTALSILYERMPGYKCKMGCGLHMGWAVEGAIGSDKKIDASYISPHVNWAEFLESSTKEYGVPVLMSEPFWRLLSPELKKITRQVDHIKKSASDEVTGIYTFDVNPDFDFKSMSIIGSGSNKTNRRKGTATAAERGRRTPTLTKKELKAGAGKQRRKTGTNSLVPATVGEDVAPNEMEEVAEESPDEGAKGGKAAASQGHGGIGNAPVIILPEYTVDIWNQDEDLVAMRTHMNDEIYDTFDKGMQQFIKGDWTAAKEFFNRVLAITDGKDGPAINIMKHMEDDYGGTPPPGWQGYRDMS
jgi:class 3 adenylate cyclase